MRIGAGAYVGIGTILDEKVVCQPNTYIGHFVKIGRSTRVTYAAQIHNGVKIGADGWVGGFLCNRAVLENQVVCLGKLLHRFVEADRHLDEEKSPYIEFGAVIGMGSAVIGGVRIGRHAYLAANSVLTRDAMAARLYVGNPARDVGSAPIPFKKE